MKKIVEADFSKFEDDLLIEYFKKYLFLDLETDLVYKINELSNINYYVGCDEWFHSERSHNLFIKDVLEGSLVPIIGE